MTDVIITGLPRCGLSPVAKLIDSLPDSVCLDSPEWQASRARRLPETTPYCKWLAGDFIWARAQLQRQKPLPDATLPIRSGLGKNFLLCMKHSALYTALLPELVHFNHFKIIAVLRHPLDTITAWQKLRGDSLSEGKIPDIAAFWPEADKLFNTPMDALDRMVQLYELFCQRYYELKDHLHIIRYEDVLADPTIISKILGIKETPEDITENQVQVRDQNSVIAERLRKYSVYSQEFYK